MTRAGDQRAFEWPSLRIGLVAAAAAALLFLVVGGAAALLSDEPPVLDLVERCLRQEKLLDVRRATDDPIAATASRGALATRVEGNGVHVSIAGSGGEAARLADRYRSVAGPLVGRLELRGSFVYVWEGLATPTQRQTMYDCVY